MDEKLEFVCYDVLADYGRTQAIARRNYRGYVQSLTPVSGEWRIGMRVVRER